MPFHRTLLPILGGVLGTAVAGPLGGAAGVGIVSSLLGVAEPTRQALPVGVFPAQITPTIPTIIAPRPDPLIWTGVAFIGSDSAQRKLASQLWNTLKISPEDVVLLHNNTSKAQFLIDGRRLLLELTAAPPAPAAAPTFAPPPVMAQAPIMAPTPVSFAGAPVPITPAALPLVPIVAGAATRVGLVGIFGKIMGTLGVAAGIKAIITWLRTNPATAAGMALTLGLTADQLFDTLAEESIAKNVLLTKDDVKGFRRTLRVGKRFSKFTRVRTRKVKVPQIPMCPAKISC